jgi:hypothetical protein
MRFGMACSMRQDTRGENLDTPMIRLARYDEKTTDSDDSDGMQDAAWPIDRESP